MALDSIRVLDLSQFLSGPRAAQLLADFGAEVIKIERPGGESLRLIWKAVPVAERSFAILHRNKKGMTLNLRHPRGAELFTRLVKSADVVVENLVPGTMERMGLGYERLAEINPRLIYLGISGFGRTGPRADQPAYDLIAQASGGIIALQENPQRLPPVYWADLVTGAFGALAVMEALLERERTGQGKLIDLSMQDVMYLHNYRAHFVRALGEQRAEAQSALGMDFMATAGREVPFWNIYRTQDGLLALVAVTDAEWARLVEATGVEELSGKDFSNFPLRVLNRERGIELLTGWFASKSTEEAERMLRAARVPCSAISDPDAVNEEEQLAARDMLAQVDHPRLGPIDIPGSPLHNPEFKAHPDVGEHNEEILGALGVSAEEIEELRGLGVV
ncbi:MAG: CoA transferase [Actinomycetota bacterium]